MDSGHGLVDSLCTRVGVHRVCTHFWTEVWRRCRLEFTVEWPMLLRRWRILAGCILLQYVHGLFAQLAHRLHKPLPEPLADAGFQLLPELGEKRKMWSEWVFLTLVTAFVIWSFSPFVVARKRFYTVVLYTRLLVVLVTCQALRVLAFSSTRLPAPNYHCREGQATAMRAWPKHWTGHLIFDFRRAMLYSCGDLIFSSHTTFALSGALGYTEFGSIYIVKVVTWVAVALLSLAIIASRKHYSVDVLVAWWTVPMVFYTWHRRWTTSRPVMEEEDVPNYDDGLPRHQQRAGSSMNALEMTSQQQAAQQKIANAASQSSQNLLEAGESSLGMGQRRGSHSQLSNYFGRDPEDQSQMSQSPEHQMKPGEVPLCRLM